jgi:hypothetical protein
MDPEMIEIACKRCHKTFEAKRADTAYCSTKCRVAAHRKRRIEPPPTWWLGDSPALSERPPRRKVNGKFEVDPNALTRAELGRKLVEIAEEGDRGQPKTGRRFYYLALSHGYVRPDMSATDEGKKSRDSAYKKVTDILGALRMNGDLGWDAVLDLTRELDQWLAYDSPRDARERMRRIYDEDRWLGQPSYAILIVEKDTMEPVCKPIAGRWRMPFASSRGYSSLKLQHDVADMLRHRHAKTGQMAVVLFISDLDPSGLDLQRAWEEALDNFGVPVADFVRIGLTPEQVDALDNPILRRGIEVKDSDSRAHGYIEEYGDRCWETDILPAATIDAAIDAEIGSFLDAEQWRRRHGEIERARKLL